MAVKYLAGDRLIGTTAERTALTTALISGSTGWDINAQQSIGSGFLNWFSQSDDPNTNSRAIYDLGVGNEIDGDFVIRMKGLFDDESGGGVFYWWMGTTDNTMAISGETAIGFQGHDSKKIRTYATNSDQSYNTGGLSDALSTGNTYYIELIRNGAVLTAKVFTGSDFSTGQVGSTSSYTLASRYQMGTDYRYIGFKGNGAGRDWTAGGSYQAWDFDDIVIYDGQTSATTATYTFNFSDIPAVYPNLTNGTIFEESDTGKHYMFDGTSTWNEM